MKHFDAGDGCFLGGAVADDFDFGAFFDDAAFDGAGGYGAAAGDGEDVLGLGCSARVRVVM